MSAESFDSVAFDAAVVSAYAASSDEEASAVAPAEMLATADDDEALGDAAVLLEELAVLAAVAVDEALEDEAVLVEEPAYAGVALIANARVTVSTQDSAFVPNLVFIVSVHPPRCRNFPESPPA